jgi:hypothetical protein
MEYQLEQTGELLSTLVCINMYLVTVSILKILASEMLDKARTFTSNFLNYVTGTLPIIQLAVCN